MINLQDFIRNSELFKKFEVDDLLFVEYQCPLEESATGVWWHNNFFAYVLKGKTVLKTLAGEYNLKTGDCAFAKKGSILAGSHFRKISTSCWFFFVPDEFIKSVIQKYKIPINPAASGKVSDTIIPLTIDNMLATYFHALHTYFPQSMPPSEALFKLKFEELIVNILSSNNHLPLKCYFSELFESTRPSIREIMEANFSSNLSLDEFARLCSRSLSTFKEEFKNIFQTTPGKWLLEKRLEYSRFLLETTYKSIEEICFESGFENSSHFIRVFKSKYGLPPGKFKIQKNLHQQEK